jgi:ABC-2 type transport system ATP-binding protein
VLFSTHYLDEAEAAGTVCVMADGKIIERGTPAEMKARHAGPTLEDAYLRLLAGART